MSKFCPYCHCLILPDGHCRNDKCVLGNQLAATHAQKEKVLELCGDLGIDTEGRDINKLSKKKASKLIADLIARKTFRELYGSEGDE